MELFFREYGSGHPLIILHGLYGSSDNWHSLAKKLSGKYHVYVPDLRNHGKSPHSDTHDYDSMSEDIWELIDNLSIETPIMIGHSMGGKVAMNFCYNYTGLISKLVVVDISPVDYNNDLKFMPNLLIHQGITNALLSVNFQQAKSIKDVDNQLENKIPEIRLRQFLLKNLNFKSQPFSWKLNITAIRQNLENITAGLQLNQKPKELPETLFIRGGLSTYIRKDSLDKIRLYFPDAQIRTIENAGHWLHAEQPEALLNLLKNWL
ncbi:MAG: alpha/beta hydrolase [Marinilabiliales bacterium]|nr:MAG: alpha/beta hydrolase [Marinilabiliales bacterium]